MPCAVAHDARHLPDPGRHGPTTGFGVPAASTDVLVEMGESRTPRPEPSAGDHYERVQRFDVGSVIRHWHRAADPSRGPLRALSLVTRRWPRTHPRCMTLPQPAGMRLLPRSPYCLRQRGREQAGGCQLLRLPPVLRGLTAPRLALSGDPALSRPRIPKTNHYSTRTPVRQGSPLSRGNVARRPARAACPGGHPGPRCRAAGRGAACHARCPVAPWRAPGRRCTATAARRSAPWP